MEVDDDPLLALWEADPNYPEIEQYYRGHVNHIDGVIICPSCDQQVEAQGAPLFFASHGQCLINFLAQQRAPQQLGLQQEPAAHVLAGRIHIPVVPDDDDEDAATNSSISEEDDDDDDDAQSLRVDDAQTVRVCDDDAQTVRVYLRVPSLGDMSP